MESGYADGGPDVSRGADLGQGTVRWISKFLDKTCSEAGLTADKMRQLHQMIPGKRVWYWDQVSGMTQD